MYSYPGRGGLYWFSRSFLENSFLKYAIMRTNPTLDLLTGLERAERTSDGVIRLGRVSFPGRWFVLSRIRLTGSRFVESFVGSFRRDYALSFILFESVSVVSASGLLP